MSGSCTDRVWNQLETTYAVLDIFIKAVGLEYDYEKDEYICKNEYEVDPDWCDDDMLRSIDNAYADIGFFLGKFERSQQ